MIKFGLDILRSTPSISKHWGQCGLVANQASVADDFQTSWDILHKVLGPRLVSLFGPQHGFYGTKQDNMIETDHTIHPTTGLPLYSLYSETREPTEKMMANIDTLIVDLQIVGCRIYTWKATIAGCLRAAKKYGKRVVILDRPNPLGGEVVEGRVLDMDCTSFVGEFPIPMRHGLTSAEAGNFFNSFIGAKLETILIEGWDPSTYWSDLKRLWVLTSPNLPTIDPVYAYPGTVIFEGTNFSEGRGTGLPFQFLGAPYIKDAETYCKRVMELLGDRANGVYLRPAQFEPTSQKWKGETCRGLQIHVTDHCQLRSLDLSIAILKAAIELSDGKFAWKDPPYEYDHKTLPMKLIYGSKIVDQKFYAKDFSLKDPYWHEGVESYIRNVKPCLLYQRNMFLG